MIKNVPMINGMRIDEAHKGGGAPGPSAAQLEAEAAQKNELADLKAKETSRVDAMGRKRRGRASLITGDETGDKKQNLGS